ncbi:MAG: hypothetical protein FWD53_11445 [Phycisphaerales bacterium]|nr:hypothetical protein [Phycisphaerales bacterium]
MKLSEACLLDASGELSPATQKRLYAHIAKHPAARRQFEQIQRDMAMLRSIPTMQLAEPARQKVAANIKTGIRTQWRELERDELSNRRWKLFYSSLAGMSAVAAALLLVAGVWFLMESAAQKRVQNRIWTVGRAIDGILWADRRTGEDDALQDIHESIDEFQNQNSALALQDRDMHKLLSTLATLRSERDEIMPPPEPDSLSL